MNTRPDDLAIFAAALEKTGDMRSRFLADVCRADRALHDRMVRYLKAHEQENGPLDAPADCLIASLRDQLAVNQVGTQIGPYKLLEQIGEGGMGVVYLGEQKDPVRRLVALKVIKAGMDTRQVVARFEAERQAMAMMNHPNIAKVLDAGATDTRRPYFAMDQQEGVCLRQQRHFAGILDRWRTAIERKIGGHRYQRYRCVVGRCADGQSVSLCFSRRNDQRYRQFLQSSYQPE
ncbi:MAG: protein kinase [Pirellula sp.]